ncbi:MAG: PrgI family protein [Candidatus Liptonbacteria bacterium]|nr:PrgI family protein [Candidatus Liptonbacteria bacterium]
MHYSVPQFIEVEDKLVGPLTMKQFLWLLTGGGIIFLLYFMLKFAVWIAVAMVIGGIFAALAFFKVYNMPLISFILSFARFSIMPQIFLWKKKQEGPLKDVSEKMIFEATVQAPGPAKPRPSVGRIRSIAWSLNVKGDGEQF